MPPGDRLTRLRWVKEAIRLHPSSAEYFAGDQGWARSQLGRWEEAISVLKRVPTNIHPGPMFGGQLITLSSGATMLQGQRSLKS